MIQKGKDGNLKAMGKKSLPRELFRKSSHQPLISDESDVVLLSGQYKFIWHYLPGMHASFHWKQRSDGRKSKQSGGKQESRAESSRFPGFRWENICANSYHHYKQLSKINAVCKFSFKNQEEDFE